MPRARAVAGLASLIESDSEPDLDFFDSTDIQTTVTKTRQPMSTIKKPRGRPPAANRVTKPAARSTRAERLAAATVAAVEAAPREALADETNINAPRLPRKTGKQLDESAQLATPAQPASAMSTRVRGARGRPRGGGSAINERMTPSVPSSVSASTTKRRGRPPGRSALATHVEIPETQEEDEAMVDLPVQEEEEVVEQPSALDPMEGLTDYGMNGEVAVRRRLGELTKKYESLQMRHRDLQEVGVKEAERTFERLRKQADERTAAANKLIAELKQELAAQTALAKEGEQLRKQLEASEATVDQLEATVDDLKESLAESKGELKVLSTKYAASRTTDAKAQGGVLSTVNGGQAAFAQAKENLYGDLTGLIMRTVRREEDEDVFDCIQTGRDGRALHFKLAVENLDPSNGDDYDDCQFTYKPQLDSSRDEELIEMLPDYLAEEITFPRPQASRFYARVFKSLTERLD